MRATQHTSGSSARAAAAAPDGQPKTGQARSGAQNAPDAPASALADLREQVARLEADVRTLQSRTANRA